MKDASSSGKPPGSREKAQKGKPTGVTIPGGKHNAMDHLRKINEDHESVVTECHRKRVDPKPKSPADGVDQVHEIGSQVCVSLNAIELISCKRQPGNLRITRSACEKRYLLSLREENETPSDVFGMVRKNGLDICRNCPEGRARFKNSEKRTAPLSRHLKPALRMSPKPIL